MKGWVGRGLEERRRKAGIEGRGGAKEAREGGKRRCGEGGLGWRQWKEGDEGGHEAAKGGG